MAKRVSKRVRKEAISIAALGASSSARNVCGYGYHHAWLWPSAEASRLACDAYALIMHSTNHDQWRAIWAEAESLLRCGWSPGDEVE